MKTFTDVYGARHDIRDLYEHLKKEETSVSLSFRGVDSFLILFEAKLIIPELTVVRIDDGEIGQHYLVLNRDKLKGLESRAYAGISGIHSVNDCFKYVSSFSLDGIFIPSRYKIRNNARGIYDENSEEVKSFLSVGAARPAAGSSLSFS